MNKIEITEQFKRALELMENTNKHILITGEAGTGKSTLLDYFRNGTSKRVVILAPTGVAALNLRGQTIHSFFGFKPSVTLDDVKKVVKKVPNLYTRIDAIIIDEISMVRADLLDCVDKFLRLNTFNDEPFGGKQMIFFGDLYQLPPVAVEREKKVLEQLYETPYFFSANVMKNIDLEIIELDRVFRQRDEKFVEILNSIRHRDIDDELLEKLNQRYIPDFEPPMDEFYVYLTSTNKKAKEINEDRLSKLDGKLYEFLADFTDDFDENSYPADLVLRLKVGAQVMFLNNDRYGRWVNGTVGNVVDIDPQEEIIYVKLQDGDIVEVSPFEWTIFEYIYDQRSGKIRTREIGSFIQFPLKLAWAITIHKSQGKTFDKVVIDLSGGIFAPGQLYVALSRCRTLEGIILKQPVEKKHIFLNWQAARFITSREYERSSKILSMEEKIEMIDKALREDLILDIVYLKPNGKKSKRKVKPFFVGKMKYGNSEFLGLKAFCFKRKDERVFRIDRILNMNIVDTDSK